MQRQFNLPGGQNATPTFVGFMAWWGREPKWLGGGLSTVEAVDLH